MEDSPRRPLQILLVATTLTCTACTAERQPATLPAEKSGGSRRPNVVVVLVDDMRWDDFRAAGHPFIDTPNIDRLAREGIRFLNAFATTPLCSPSRACFLTGQYAHTNGIVDNTARSSDRLAIFPLALRRAGYRTGFFGKWHMGNDDTPRPGFDHWVGMAGQGEAIDPALNVDGRRVNARGYTTDLLTGYVERFVEDAGDRPFLAYLAHKAIHPNVIQRDDGAVVPLPGQPGGFVAADRHRGRYLGRPMPRRPSAFKPPVGKPALLRPLDGLPPLGAGTATTDDEIRGRLEMLLAVDDSLGRIMEVLARKGVLDDTAIFFTSDHGYFYGEHGLNEERRLAYEETIRIPLLVRYPRLVRPNTTNDQMALSLDLAPTVLEFAGLQPDAAIQGRSLLPLLKGRAANWRSSFLIEYFTDTVFPRIRSMGYVAVRTDRHKYIRYRELTGMDELYDLQADPYELSNIIERPEAREDLARMQAELERLLPVTKDGVLPRRPVAHRVGAAALLPQRSEALADVFGQQLRLLPRGEMAALVAFAVVDQLRIRAFGPAARQMVQIVREGTHGYGDLHALGSEESQLVLPVEPGGRNGGVGQPEQRDVVEHVVACQTFRDTVERARDQLEAAPIMIDHEGGETDG
jgi:N-acetylglucosamine-6-sulfatase